MNDSVQPAAIFIESEYLPTVASFALMQSFEKIIIDQEEVFRKSTARNRCTIMGANGPILLTVPVEGGRGVKKIMKDVRITYEEPWQRIHWGSIISAYGKSAYFKYYKDDFKPCYEKHFSFLIDFNQLLLHHCLKLLNRKPALITTQSVTNEIVMDARNKKFDAEQDLPYHQVFIEKHGFIPGLSFIDLLFNMGTESKGYLENYAVRNFRFS